MPDKAALRKQAADAGAIDTGQYIEWLETRPLALLEADARDEETLP